MCDAVNHPLLSTASSRLWRRWRRKGKADRADAADFFSMKTSGVSISLEASLCPKPTALPSIDVRGVGLGFESGVWACRGADFQSAASHKHGQAGRLKTCPTTSGADPRSSAASARSAFPVIPRRRPCRNPPSQREPRSSPKNPTKKPTRGVNRVGIEVSIFERRD